MSGTSVTSPSAVGGSSSMSNSNNASSAVPTLKVMRIQAPELANCGGICDSSLILPDSFGVIYIGERFCAYLGALNPSSVLEIFNLQIVVQLQTPSTRHVLQTDQDTKNIPPLCGVSSIVSQTLEEVGPHILRVEVSYGDSTRKMLRKFYRFTVSNPIQIRQLTTRHSSPDGNTMIAHVSISVSHSSENQDNTTDANNNNSTPLLLTQVHIQPPPACLTCRRIDPSNHYSPSTDIFSSIVNKDNVGNLLDQDEDEDESVDTQYTATGEEEKELGIWLQVGQTQQFLFEITTPTDDIPENLGNAMVTWKKAMGETGRIASATIPCPSDGTNTDITVQVVNPPKTLPIGIPTPIQIRITTAILNSNNRSNWQLQLNGQNGLVICGPSRRPIPADKNDNIMTVYIMGTMSGFVPFGESCSIVDTTKTYYQQTKPLFHTFIERPTITN